MYLFGADPKVITVPDPDTVSPGFLGFAVMFLLAIATVLLIRSMVAHLRKVRYLPEPGEATSTSASPASKSSGSTSSPGSTGTSGPASTSGPA